MRSFLQTYRSAALVLALLLLFAGPVLADQVQGTIALIEHDDHWLTLVDDSNNVMTIRFLVGGEVRINDEDLTFWDLVPGQRVTVTFDRLDNEMCATLIESNQP